MPLLRAVHLAPWSAWGISCCPLPFSSAFRSGMWLKSMAPLTPAAGVYVWGKDWIQAKTQAETYDYLFQVSLQPPASSLQPCINEGGTRVKGAFGPEPSQRPRLTWCLAQLGTGQACALERAGSSRVHAAVASYATRGWARATRD